MRKKKSGKKIAALFLIFKLGDGGIP